MTYCCITGATSGIGQACAYYFAEKGHNLFLIARRWHILEHMKYDLMQKYNIDVIIGICDVSSYLMVTNLFDTVWAIDVDILINNAWLAKWREYIVDISAADIDEMINTNIKGTLYISQKIIPLMQNKGIHVFNIWSISATNVYPWGATYCATKAAINALSQLMRLELQKDNIMVTCINPGLVNTNFQLVRANWDQEWVDHFLDQKLWSGKQLEPWEIATLIYSIIGRNIFDLTYWHKL